MKDLRDHTWEFLVSAVSWIVALGVLVFVAIYVAHDTFKTRRQKKAKVRR